MFAFQWFSNLVYVAATGSVTLPAYTESKSTPADSNIYAIDVAYTNALKQLPNAKRYGVTPASGKDGVVYIYGYNLDDVYYNSDELRYDQYSGKLLFRKSHTEKNNGEKIIEMNYDIHVGAVGGLTGKIIAFIISFICASLPVTGFLVW